ncbi:MAG: MBL fold metallo-hydrolase [Candidatus Lokiarchaeota archaeon]|nr:MBL fold metallo-hydrolase [Candidatus Lokiarchaeota archaeon]
MSEYEKLSKKSDFSNIRNQIIGIRNPKRNVLFMRKRKEKELTAITLGTGNPVPAINRAGCATAIIYNKTCLLIDCGRWVTRQLIQAEIPFNQIVGLFITHNHQDHINGWPTLWMDSIFTRKTTPWKIWGPKGTKEIFNSVKIFNKLDIIDRKAINLNINGLKIEVVEIEDGFTLNLNDIKISATTVNHTPHMPCFAYRFDTSKKSILISGDTTKTQNLIDLGKKAPVDILVHEIVLDDVVRFAVGGGLLLGDEDTADRIIDVHSTIRQVIDIANEIKPKKLVLTHIIPTVASPKYIEGKISEEFDGEVICANDLDEF